MSLAAKLAEVMEAIERVPKRGWNDFHKYAYATEADIVAAVRAELASRQVILLPAITNTESHEIGAKGDILTTLTMEFTFIDGESKEELTRPWVGAGADKGDKGTYKAMTGGEKYFLLKTFLIATGDDPEIDGTQPDIQLRDQAVPTRSAPPLGKPIPKDDRPVVTPHVQPPPAARVHPSRFSITKPRAATASSMTEPPPPSDADAPPSSPRR